MGQKTRVQNALYVVVQKRDVVINAHGSTAKYVALEV